MSARWSFLPLSLLLSVPALAEEGVTVRVRCTEKCTVVLDGKRGLRVNDATWEFKGIAPGARRVEATGVLGRPFARGYATIPDAAEAHVIVTGNQRIVVEERATVEKRDPVEQPSREPGTPAWAEEGGAKEAEGARGRSVVIIRCPEDCTVLLEGRRGVRRDKRTWRFTDVEPGQRRVEATGGVFDQRLFVDYVEIPGGSEVTLYGDSKGHVTLTNRKALEAGAPAKPTAVEGEASRINVRCLKPCTVSLDRTRRGGSSTSSASTVVIHDVPPGEHSLEVTFTIGKRVSRADVEVPASSEVFVTASDGGGVQVTNTKPLGSG